jgi:N-acetyl sugar amidotransferase
MKTKKTVICKKTVMDTSDPNITFDIDGVSDYYHYYKNNILPDWNFGKNKLDELLAISDKIKKENKNNDFDCIIGLSGGLDSSFAAYIAKEIMGLRPLIFHVDAGWNTQKAVENIEKLVDGLNLDLYTEVINWEEMKDLQRSFFLSGIADQDLPQDYAFFSSLYKFARKYKIKTILTGGNFSTECVREPEEWGGYAGIDTRLVSDIHSKFGTIPLKTFPMIDILKYKIYYRYFLGMKVIKPCDFVPFEKKDVESLLKKNYGWEKFKHKHHESRFTRFYEDYWLVRKFGFDKRKAHFSSLILTGQMSRSEALKRLEHPEMDVDFLNNEFEYVANKLDFTKKEFEQIFKSENRSISDYKSKKYIINLGKKVLMYLGIEKRMYR